jgi:hypothetical protein
MSDGEFNERQIAAQIELLQNIGAVRVNRPVADEKLVPISRLVLSSAISFRTRRSVGVSRSSPGFSLSNFRCGGGD